MTNLNIIRFGSHQYYISSELYTYDPTFFGNINRRSDILKKVKIPEGEYIYAYEKENKWIRSEQSYKVAKILIKKTWADLNVPKLKIDIINKNKLTEEQNTEIDIEELYEIPPAPEILELNDEEKFKDKDGNILEIEVRGERNCKKCYFKVKDVSDGFIMPNLQDTILDIKLKDGYIVDEHYKFFYCQKTGGGCKNIIKKTLFLTYEGIIRLLYVSHSPNAKYFRIWATEKLFAIQLGSEDDKLVLVKTMFGGASVRAIKETFKTCSDKTPCIYLYIIGHADQLLKCELYRGKLLLKYGFTDDLPRRSSEHERTFKKLFSIDHIELICYSVIDPKYISDAERSISHYFNADKIVYDDYKELIVLSMTDIDKAKEHYRLVKNSYIGCYREMQDRIDKLELKLKDKDMEIIVMKKDNEMSLIKKDHELQIKNHELRIKDKDIEILMLKNRLLENSK
jgi:hypothetical protein